MIVVVGRVHSLGSAKSIFGVKKAGEKSAKLPFFHEHFQKIFISWCSQCVLKDLGPINKRPKGLVLS
jgi:hypothetical protein